jgi:hypothetical protein
LAIDDSIAHPIVFACVLLVAVVISLLLALSPVLIAVRPDLQRSCGSTMARKRR